MSLLTESQTQRLLKGAQTTKPPWQQFLAGMSFLWLGIRLSLNPKLRRYVWLPILCNLILFATGTYFFFHWFDNTLLSWLFDWVPTELPDRLSWLNSAFGWLLTLVKSVLWLLLILALLFIFASLFTTLTHLIAAPFLAFLAARVETETQAIHHPSFGIKATLYRTVQRERQKLTFWLPKATMLATATALTSWIPVINLITPLLWTLFTAWMLCLQYLDFTSDNQGRLITETLAQMKNNPYTTLGFGCATLAITLIPIINWLALSSATIGATLLWVYRMQNSSMQP